METITPAMNTPITHHDTEQSAMDKTRPSRAEAEAAVQTLLRWAGDNPAREGLKETPRRVVKAYEEFFSGYAQDPLAVLNRTFKDVSGYEDMVVLRGIPFESHCEHHVLPIIGHVHVGYWPKGRVVGLSKLARVVDIFAKRLQTQESMTAQIGDTIQEALNPEGVAILVEAEHACMSLRGVHKSDIDTITSYFSGVFKQNEIKERFLKAIKKN